MEEVLEYVFNVFKYQNREISIVMRLMLSRFSRIRVDYIWHAGSDIAFVC